MTTTELNDMNESIEALKKTLNEIIGTNQVKLDTNFGMMQMDYDSLANTYRHLYSPEMFQKFYMMEPAIHKNKASVRSVFLVVGNQSFNLDELSKFEIKADNIAITIGAFNYYLYEKDIENYNDIPELIYAYFDRKHGKPL